jgi:DNA invertase Pin-like site-specific DNA recombinase
MANALVATRLSHKTDESTSIERQTEQGTLTAQIRGDKVIHITEDTDISGSVSPFLRDGLGPWLTEQNKIDQWDVLIVSKVDRLTRSLSDFDDLVAWLDRNGKTLVSVSESLDLSTSTGRMFANLLAMFAQFERERMSERRRDAAVKIRENGWWAGFGYPYGTRPVKVESHWELEIDPATYARLEQIAYEIIRGHSVSSIAKSLNALQVPTPSGGKEWRQNTIRDICTNEKCVLEPELLGRVIEALDTTKQAWTKRGDAAMLLNVAHCVCGAPFHSKRYTSKGHLYEYYDCSAHCGERRIPMKDLEKAADESMTDGYGWVPVFTKQVKLGKSHAKEIAILERKMNALDKDASDWLARTSELHAERARLKSLPREPDEIKLVPTGKTTAEYWPTLSAQGKRQFLLVNKATLHARRAPDGFVIVSGGPDPKTFEGGEYFETIEALSTLTA